ncbi:MAG: hypothetical protein IJI14_16655, partial [Anaerolineaceae bacterium]|nr:hypothetical protein [Anaerolineaceae bacterium]
MRCCGKFVSAGFDAINKAREYSSSFNNYTILKLYPSNQNPPEFDYLQKLHHSQTVLPKINTILLFDYLQKLHHSQT